MLNPKRSDCQYPEKNLAGVGVALKLVQVGLSGAAMFGPDGRVLLQRRLARGAVAGLVVELGGEATVDFLPRGVVYTVTCALDHER